MEGKVLGSIRDVRFGFGGYQNAQFGLTLTFEGEGCGTQTFIGHWPLRMPRPDNAQWTEEDRERWAVDLVRQVENLLHEAKILEVHQLRGKPIEMTFESSMLKSWRILTEVL